MPRYFFHACRTGSRIEDPQGSDFVDLDAARADAVAAARELLAQNQAGQDMSDWWFEITVEPGMQLATVPFRDAIEPP
jgi:hypothetical protein